MNAIKLRAWAWIGATILATGDAACCREVCAPGYAWRGADCVPGGGGGQRQLSWCNDSRIPLASAIQNQVRELTGGLFQCPQRIPSPPSRAWLSAMMKDKAGTHARTQEMIDRLHPDTCLLGGLETFVDENRQRGGWVPLQERNLPGEHGPFSFSGFDLATLNNYASANATFVAVNAIKGWNQFYKRPQDYRGLGLRASKDWCTQLRGELEANIDWWQRYEWVRGQPEASLVDKTMRESSFRAALRESARKLASVIEAPCFPFPSLSHALQVDMLKRTTSSPGCKTGRKFPTGQCSHSPTKNLRHSSTTTNFKQKSHSSSQTHA